MIKVTAVRPGSIADELGLVAGTELVSINGRELEDFLDWEFLAAEEEFTLLVRQPDGQEIEFEIERPLTEALGVTVEPARIRRCANRCDFCFVDGLPEGLREVLYIRDDDYRLSFQYGNFATLTNLKPKDVARIIEYRLSPLYVSVHATDPVTRRWLLRNPTAPDILEQLRHFAAHGIRYHTQIVLSPGINDGTVLERTFSDLFALGDPVLSVSVVPVGLTEFSKHSLVREPTEAECRTAAQQVAAWQGRALSERGAHWVYGADELYLRAGLELPPESSYEEFDQVENGVGSVRFLQRRIRDDEPLFSEWRGRRIGVVTGTSMGALMPQVLQPLTAASGASFELIVVANGLFGPRVTTAGLLPGRSIAQALARHHELDFVLLPAEAVNDDLLFIDGMSATSLAEALPLPVRFSKYFSDAVEAGVAA
jgi:putative radical SAM enzyme (TIGR03279 family)